MADESRVELGTPVVGEDEIDAIRDVFETGWVLNGPTNKEFQETFADYIGCDHAVSVVNCTAGMQLALASVGLPDDAKVLLPGQSFIANGIAVRQNGFEPIFADVDPETYNISPEAIAEYADEADAILLIHYAGYACDMDAINDIADDHDLAVVEDAAHALGSEYHGDKIGNHGDVTVFSFGPLKMITTGMGGMITTERDDIKQEIESRRSYGMNSDAWSREESQKPWQYSIPNLGHNYRLSDIAAGMGLAQLEKLEDFIAHRRARADEYERRLDEVAGIKTPVESDDRRHTYLYYVIRVTEEFGINRDELAHELMDHDVGVSVHWDPPLHQHLLFRDKYQGKPPISEDLADRLITLPMHPELASDDVEYVCNVIAAASDGSI